MSITMLGRADGQVPAAPRPEDERTECGVRDRRDADWSQPSTVVLGTQVDQQVLPPGAEASREEGGVDRRDAIRALGGATVGSLVSAAEPSRRQLDEALRAPTTVYDVNDWDRTAHEYAYLVARPWECRYDLLSRLLVDFDEVNARFTTAEQGWQPRLAGVAARLSGLAAIVLFTNGYWSDAGRYWRISQSAAEASNDHDLRCLVGGRRAILTLHGPGGPKQAMSLADDVLAMADGKPSPGAANALATRAHVHALRGDRANANRTLSELERVFGTLDDGTRSDITTWGWSESRLLGARSFVHSYTGNVPDAMKAHDAALAMYSSPLARGVAQVKFHQAASMMVSGDAAGGARYASEVYDSLPPSLKNGHLRTSISFALSRLPERAARLPEVREVRALAALPA